MQRSGRGGKVTVIAALLVLLTSVAQAAERCTVADPTGTPLNLRSEPNGTIVDRLENGLVVSVLERRSHKGKRWAMIETASGTTGWAFAAYLDCPKAKTTLGNTLKVPERRPVETAPEPDQQKSAPMKPRPSPAN